MNFIRFAFVAVAFAPNLKPGTTPLPLSALMMFMFQPFMKKYFNIGCFKYHVKL